MMLHKCYSYTLVSTLPFYTYFYEAKGERVHPLYSILFSIKRLCKRKGYKIKCMNKMMLIVPRVTSNHYLLDVSTVNRVSYIDEEAFVDSECIPPYDDANAQALINHEEHFLGLGSFSGHECSEDAKDSNEYPVEKEFEDFLYSSGANSNVYVLSSGRWNVNQGILHVLDS